MTRLDSVGIQLNQFEMFEEHETFYQDENNVEWKPCINWESKSLELTIKLYSCHDINMEFLVVVTPPSIYQKVTVFYGFNMYIRVDISSRFTSSSTDKSNANRN